MRVGDPPVGGRYSLVEPFGPDERFAGGKVATWRAQDSLVDRAVVLRVMTPGGKSAKLFLDRALEMSLIAHPGLGMVYDAVDLGEHAIVVCEWIDGTSLADTLKAHGPLSPTVARKTLGDVAEAIAVAHHAGLPIGGITAERVVLRANASVTVTGVPALFADERGDIQQLGKLLYAALTGEEPALDDPDLAKNLHRGVPRDLAVLCQRALDNDPARQLGSAAAFAAVLRPRTKPRSPTGTTAGRTSERLSNLDAERASAPVQHDTSPARIPRASKAAAQTNPAKTNPAKTTSAKATPGRATPAKATRAKPPEAEAGPAEADGGAPKTVRIPVRGAAAATAGTPATQAVPPTRAIPTRRPAVEPDPLVVPARAPSPPTQAIPTRQPPSGAHPTGAGTGSAATGGSGAGVDEARTGSAPTTQAISAAGTNPAAPAQALAPTPAQDRARDDWAVQAAGPLSEPVIDSPIHTTEDYDPWQDDTGTWGTYDDIDDDPDGDFDEGSQTRRKVLLYAVPLAALLLIVLMAVFLGKQLNSVVGGDNGPAVVPTSELPAASTPAPTESVAPAETAAAAPLALASAAVYNPFGDGGPEHDGDVFLAADGDPATAWQTLTYQSTPEFGNLKPGVGVIFDLGAEHTVTSVELATTLPGSAVEIHVGAAPDAPLESYALVGTLDPFTDTATIPLAQPVQARFVIVWFVRLVPSNGGFQAALAECRILGT